MLGSGNDNLDVVGTLNPARPVTAANEFIVTPSGVSGGTIERRGFDWKANGFLVGQSVQIDGYTGTWTVTAIDDFVANPTVGADPNDNSILVLAGPDLGVVPTGELTIVGIDALIEVLDSFTVVSTPTGGELVRTSGSWLDDGFIENGLVRLIGETFSGEWRLDEISADGLTMILTGAALPVSGAALLNVSMPGPHGGLTLRCYLTNTGPKLGR